MTDKELLELAAKAAGIDSRLIDGIPLYTPSGRKKAGESKWNPLIDDGDALRLAVKLHLFSHGDHEFIADLILTNSTKDPYAATRRAIVRAAAKIGKELK